MDLRDKISAELKSAMKSKEAAKLSTLRLISAAIKDKDIALRGQGKADGVSEADILGILGKMVKQRQETARTYEEAGRLELAEQELAEIEVIEAFLPTPLDEAEIDTAIQAAITELKAESIRDMGRVIGALKSRYTGQMDFGRVGPMVKERLSA
ncbi:MULTISPECIES: GatB/YqeY domain-containing protein [unclassified Dinoroseobacter]|uniref:GatB/YqeY domain-containing protein n=1 Tax=unclassified Dinoroseobacter TaxID=2620028 RepID=UPI003C7B87D8